MRITFLLSTANMSGGVRVISIYAKYLQKAGHTISIVYRPKKTPSFTQKVKSLLRGRGWPTVKALPPSHIDALNVNKVLLESVRAANKNDIPDGDVIIATWWETAEWLKQLPPTKGKKVYFIQHHEIHSHLPIERVKATLREPSFKQITIAQWIVDILNKYYHQDNITLVPNGVCTDFFHSPPRGKNSTPTFLIMYSEVLFKGCDISIQAFEHVKKRYPDIKLYLFSSHKPVRSLPIPEWAEFYYQPSQETIRSLYSQADAYIFSSRSEGFGLPILEAMACRTPVIATPTGAAPELLQNGGGTLLENHDVEKMAECIIKYIEMSNTDWQHLSDSAYTSARAHDWGKSALLFEKTLINTLNN